MINRPARAPLTSRSRGSSLEISTNRVESLPVQAGMCLRSMVWSSSPLIDSRHSTIAALSGRLESRASGKTAIGLPMKLASPNGRARVDRVGLTTEFEPASAFNTRAIVPRPERLGPTIIRIFCCLRVGGQQVAEPFLECRDALGVGAPDLLEEAQPLERRRGRRVEIVFQRIGIEEPGSGRHGAGNALHERRQMHQGVLRRQDLLGRPGRARLARVASIGAGIPTGHAGSQAGWAGTCRDETITRLARAWRTSLTRRPVTGIGRGTDLDRAVAAAGMPRLCDPLASDRPFSTGLAGPFRSGPVDRTARIPRRSSA